MVKKLIRQNKAFISIIVTLFILFGLVLYFGTNQIYELEAKRQHGNSVAQLHAGTEIIKGFFSESAHNMSFLRNLPGTRSFVNSDFKSVHYKKSMNEIFYDFEDVKQHSYFQEAMKLEKDQIQTFLISLNSEQGSGDEPYDPIISLATPLFNSKNKKKGILILDTYFSKVIEVIPENMFIQTEEGDMLSLKPDGPIAFHKSNYVFPGLSGWLYISAVESIHYTTVEFLPGRRFVVAIYHSHPMLKAALQKLMFVSVILLASFLCLILIIGYLNIVRFRDLIGAQKAIIFSLAGLTERRDPETGQHLERTKKYTAELAKQLRENKKYRKFITSEFIEDISDAAPLHDIGKVGIRDSVLLKKSKLTQEEYEEMKEHVRIGKQILQDAIDTFKLKQPFLLVGRNICAYHHEKYDGKGYLEGLKGTEIPLEARIFTLCDTYDAIRSKRPYKDALPHEEAVRRIMSDSGEHFDPDIVDAFLKIENEFAKICNAK